MAFIPIQSESEQEMLTAHFANSSPDNLLPQQSETAIQQLEPIAPEHTNNPDNQTSQQQHPPQDKQDESSQQSSTEPVPLSPSSQKSLHTISNIRQQVETNIFSKLQDYTLRFQRLIELLSVLQWKRAAKQKFDVTLYNQSFLSQLHHRLLYDTGLLDESLMSHLFTLDSIETEGREDVRIQRKSMVVKIEEVISVIENMRKRIKKWERWVNKMPDKSEQVEQQSAESSKVQIEIDNTSQHKDENVDKSESVEKRSESAPSVDSLSTDQDIAGNKCAAIRSILSESKLDATQQRKPSPLSSQRASPQQPAQTFTAHQSTSVPSSTKSTKRTLSPETVHALNQLHRQMKAQNSPNNSPTRQQNQRSASERQQQQQQRLFELLTRSQPQRPSSSISCRSHAAPTSSRPVTSMPLSNKIFRRYENINLARIQPHFQQINSGKDVKLVADLSGVYRDDLQAIVYEEQSLLTVRGVRLPRSTDDRHFGWFEQHFQLDDAEFNIGQAVMQFEDGVLQITLPRKIRPLTKPLSSYVQHPGHCQSHFVQDDEYESDFDTAFSPSYVPRRHYKYTNRRHTPLFQHDFASYNHPHTHSFLDSILLF